MSTSALTLRMVLLFTFVYSPLWMPLTVSGLGWLKDAVRDRGSRESA